MEKGRKVGPGGTQKNKKMMLQMTSMTKERSSGRMDNERDGDVAGALSVIPKFYHPLRRGTVREKVSAATR